MCAECHNGPLLTDGLVHVTGIAQLGEPDAGIGAAGGFFTPPLRQIDKTGPYMHDGSLRTLAEVIEFYRRGGDSSGYVGEKDALVLPLDITDEEAHDLEAFLHSLTGQPVDGSLARDIR
jgi:cytochrome c peroxidase